MIVDIEVRDLLIKIRNVLEMKFGDCFGIMALCNNCQQKCDKEKKIEKFKKEIDNILEDK